MIKCTDFAIGFREVPDEISLLINISNCPYHCEGCHTPYLQQDIGEELTVEKLDSAVRNTHGGITCVCFLGDGQDLDYMKTLLEWCKNHHLNTCLYTGDSNATRYIRQLGNVLDYLKIGPYIEKYGSLDKPTTNQRMYRITNKGRDITDITSSLQHNITY